MYFVIFLAKKKSLKDTKSNGLFVRLLTMINQSERGSERGDLESNYRQLDNVACSRVCREILLQTVSHHLCRRRTGPVAVISVGRRFQL